MLRVTTIHASSASASAAYYTQYLADAPGEAPGVWSGRQAPGLGLVGRVNADDLETLLEGRDPTSGTPLGNRLVDRTLRNGKVVRAVDGFDATFSAPKSVSVWWALTGDPGLLAAHDVAVTAALAHLERFGATTRVRVDGARQHPDTLGLTMATFRQTTSRADDPQLHTHAVISAKVQTDDGRWLALDARYLKRHQRMLGGLYQSVLRAELSHRYGIAWEPIVHGQAEIAGMSRELIDVFSKRARQVDAALAAKVDEFREREGRDPSRWERAAMTREASADTRGRKSGNGVTDLRTRWETEAAERGWTAPDLDAELRAAGRGRVEPGSISVEDVIDALSASGSTWSRADVMRAITARQTTVSSIDGYRWAAALERACDRVVDVCVDLDPVGTTERRRASDGRSVRIEPTAPYLTSDAIVAEEEFVLSWAMGAQADDPDPSRSVDAEGLNVLQAEAAAAVAGTESLVLIAGPAGAGKTTTLRRAVDDLANRRRPVFGVAPTAKAAAVLGRETAMATDTVAKLLYEWTRPDRPPGARHQLTAGTTLIVDETGMIGTASLAQLVRVAQRERWRLALVGDPRQLQAVGRGGLFNELCATGRTRELTRIHRFRQPWEAAASLQLRGGGPAALAAYEAHGRIIAGPFEAHLDEIARRWCDLTRAGRRVAITTATNDHVDAINGAIQRRRFAAGELPVAAAVTIAGAEIVYRGDIVATRRNDRELRTTDGEPVRNRELWDVAAAHANGALTVSHRGGHGTITLPAEYVRDHVRLGYAATEHGNQGDTVDVGLQLVSPVTTQRGLYVGATRGRDDNRMYVVTETTDPAEARDVLEAVLCSDRADIPAVTQRRQLAGEGALARPSQRQHDLIPGGLAPERTRLVERREQLVALLNERAERRADAAAQRAALQPSLDAARAAWAPYEARIRQVDAELRDKLRPAMWKANGYTLRASFGHRHAARRRAQQATRNVDDEEARITAIQTEGAEARQHLDTIQAEATRLEHLANPSPYGIPVDQSDRAELERTERLILAIDTWTSWAGGRRVATADLATAVATLVDAAHEPHHYSLAASDRRRSPWQALLEPIASALPELAISSQRGPAAKVGHERSFGIDL